MPSWIEEDLEHLRNHDLYRTRRRIQSGQGAEVRFRSADMVNFSSNDYLGYGSDPRLARAAARAAQRFGAGAGASALVSGHSPPLRALERGLAAWEGTEAALVFASGFLGNLAVVSTLAGREDALFSDAYNHASLIDGCRLSRATTQVYRHNDLQHLEELLRQQGPGVRRRFIVSDSVFSMDGDLADLPGLLDLAKRYDAYLILDEAHATGVLGPQGRGLSDLLPQADRKSDRLIKVGTLSKSLAAQGGFVVGSSLLIDWLVNRARPYIFATALAPPLAAAARLAIRLVGKEPERRNQVLALAQRLREGLRSLGFDVGPSTTHIVPVILGDAERTLAWSRRLERHFLLVPAIRPPSVPPGTSRLRISLSAAHTEADIDRLLAVFASA
ncbi:MAG: 8-amino-7-oxononanoate synthase [Gemmataceae bacterium]